MIKIKEFSLEESKVSKNNIMLLIAVDEDGGKWVVGGNSYYPAQAVPYDKCYDVSEEGEL